MANGQPRSARQASGAKAKQEEAREGKEGTTDRPMPIPRAESGKIEQKPETDYTSYKPAPDDFAD